MNGFWRVESNYSQDCLSFDRRVAQILDTSLAWERLRDKAFDEFFKSFPSSFDKSETVGIFFHRRKHGKNI